MGTSDRMKYFRCTFTNKEDDKRGGGSSLDIFSENVCIKLKIFIFQSKLFFNQNFSIFFHLEFVCFFINFFD